MPAPPLDSWAAEGLTRKLHDRFGLTHLRARKRGRVLTVESGPQHDPWPHFRLRRDTVHLYVLEMPARGGRWERTPFRDNVDNLLEALVSEFAWTLEPIDLGDLGNQGETSDREN